MAVDITISLTDERQAELQKLTDTRNIAFPSDPQSISQFLRSYVRDWLDMSAAQRAETEKLGLRTLYKAATPQEQATIDAILDKYR